MTGINLDVARKQQPCTGLSPTPVEGLKSRGGMVVDVGYALAHRALGDAVGEQIGHIGGRCGVVAAFAGPMIARQGVGRVYGLMIAVMAVGIGSAAASPDVWLAAACVVVSGVGNGAAFITSSALNPTSLP